MFNFLKKSGQKQNPAELERINRLETDLSMFKGNSIDSLDKEKIKSHLLMKIQNNSAPFTYREENLIMKIKRIGKSLRLPKWAFFEIRERLLSRIESGNYNVNPGFTLNPAKAYVSTLVLMAFVSSIVVFAPINTPVSFAKCNIIDQVRGQVYVYRNAVFLPATANMMLKEGDKIVTRNGSSATLHFFDDSVTRLSENTDLEIQKLEKLQLKPLATDVQVFLEKGRLWAKVLSLPDDAEFTVNTKDIQADVSKKAAFDLTVDNNKAEVSVFDNSVNVVPQDKPNEVPKTLIAGYKAQVDPNTSDDLKIEKMVRKDAIVENSTWVAENLKSDEKYRSDLIENKEENIVNETTALADNKTEETVSANPEVEVLKNNFLEAYDGLIKGESQLMRGDREAAVHNLKNFNESVKEILLQLPEIQKTDAAGAAILKTLMKDKVAAQLNEMAPLSPGNRLYRAKEELQDIDLSLADSDVDRVDKQLSQSGEVLFEIQELISNGQYTLVSTMLKRYNNKTDGLVVTASADGMQEVKDKFAPIMQEQVEQIKTLTAIENSIVNLDQKDLKEKVREFRGQIMQKFIDTMEKNPNIADHDAVLQVKDLYETYLAGTDDAVAPAIDKLADNLQMSFIQPDNVETPDLGIISVIPSEASPDIVIDVEEEKTVNEPSPELSIEKDKIIDNSQPISITDPIPSALEELQQVVPENAADTLSPSAEITPVVPEISTQVLPKLDVTIDMQELKTDDDIKWIIPQIQVCDGCVSSAESVSE